MKTGGIAGSGSQDPYAEDVPAVAGMRTGVITVGDRAVFADQQHPRLAEMKTGVTIGGDKFSVSRIADSLRPKRGPA